MPYQAEIDRATSAEWAVFLESFADANIYQTWSYGAIRWGERNLSHLVLKQDGAVAALAQLRIVRVPLLKCGMAYLRWGPLCQLRGNAIDPEVLRHTAMALYDEYVGKRGLFLRILPNAFIASQRAEALCGAFSQSKMTATSTTDSYRTLVLNLTPSLDELRKKLDQKWRNQLNRAEKNGLQVSEGNRPEEYRIFAKLYQEMRDRKRFETTVDVEEFGRIQENLIISQRMKVLICWQSGIPVAGLVCSAMGDTGIYLLGATSNAGMQSKGAYLLQWTMIKWLKDRGFRYYDLGGIDPVVNPSVYHFKSGLSGLDVRHIQPHEACISHLSLLGSKILLVKGGQMRKCLQGCFARQQSTTSCSTAKSVRLTDGRDDTGFALDNTKDQTGITSTTQS